MREAKGQPFRLYDFYKYTIANGDLPIYDRMVKSSSPEVSIENADDFLDWMESLDPALEAIRLG